MDMSVEINQMVTAHGAKVDNILKRAKETKEVTGKSSELLQRLKERTGRVSVCYRFVVYVAVMAIALFLFVLMLS